MDLPGLRRKLHTGCTAFVVPQDFAWRCLRRQRSMLRASPDPRQSAHDFLHVLDSRLTRFYRGTLP